MVDISFLEAENVSLCLLNEEHIDTYASWMNDPDVRRFAHDLPYYTPKDYRNLIINPNPNRFLFEICKKPKNQLIGITGFSNISWQNRIGYIVINIGNTNLWSKKIGTDTVMLLFQFGFKDLNLRKIFSCIDSPNITAIQTAKKMMTLEATLKEIIFINGQYCDQLIFSITQEDWFNGLNSESANKTQSS